MSQLFSFQKIGISLFCVLVFSLSAFGQNGNLQNDLSKSFKKFKVVRFNSQTVLGRAESGSSSLVIPTGEKSLELILTPNDLRSPRYRAEDTTAKGVRTRKEDKITTFRGKVAGKNNSEVRLTIDDTKIEGYFFTEDDKFFIESAKNYSSLANAKDFVVYRAEDLLKPDSFTCNSDLAEKIERGKEMVAINGIESVQSVKVLEIATEADFDYVTALGGATQANNEILSVLNMVEGVYANELNLSIRVVFQHTWSIQDSYIGTNTNSLLTSFKNYWNAIYRLAD